MYGEIPHTRYFPLSHRGNICYNTEENNPPELYIGRIFIDPALFRRGFGTGLMKCAEALFPDCAAAYLDTPDRNTRTNAFYRKLGYTEVKRDGEFIIYGKSLIQPDSHKQ